MSEIHYNPAPWSLSIKVVTAVGSGLLLLVPCVVLQTASPLFLPIAAGCLGVWIICLLSMVRGYQIENSEIVVHRPLWQNRIPFSSGATAFQKEMPMSIRLFGNGGLFSGSGYFWNKEAGIFRAFITDPSKGVWIKTPAKTIIISPDNPEDFIKAFTEHPASL